MRRLTLPILFVSMLPLAAQTDRASLTGVVTDASHSVVPNAKVSVHAAATGIDYNGNTNTAGVYTFTGLTPGQYSASISAGGFETLQVQAFTLEVGETRTLNASLRIGSVSANVTVVDATPDLTLATAEVGGVITGKQTEELPVNGRYWASLEALIPGAISAGTGTQDTIRFSGLSQEDNNFRFDGVDATGLNHQFVKVAARLQFPLESIAEFKASSAVYSADVGGMAGGQVSMVSKSGGNDFHSSLYEYLRNSFFDAKAFDAPSLSPFRMNNFGASFGGPVIHNKLFFFVNYEGIRQAFTQSLSGFVPTDAYRALVAQRSPALAPLINAYPEGNVPTADPNALLWITGGRSPSNEDGGLFRIDYVMNEKTNISMRFNTDQYYNISPALAENTITTMDTPNAVVDIQHTFSPSMLNDAKVGFNRDNYQDVGDGKSAYSLSITGFTGYSLGDHSFRIDNSYSFVDDFTYTNGRHTIKAGVEIRRMQENKLHPNAARGLSYISETNFVNNLLDSYSFSPPGVETQARKNPYYGYVLDEFKIRPNLTLNAGLRYEYYGVDYDKDNIGRVFDPFSCGLQYCPPGTAFYYPNSHDFEPRVSVAWAPEALHGKTAIRAGAGISYSDGQFGGLYAAQTNIGLSYSLTQANIPGLTFPVDPFVANAAYSLSYSGKDRHRKDVAVDQWTFSIQQEVAKDTIVQATYLGTKGTHEFSSQTLNGINVLTGTRAFASLTNSTIGYGNYQGNSNLEALQLGLRRNMNTGLLVSANYQYSHGISDGANGDGESDSLQNNNCRTCERGNADFDVRHNFTASVIWIVPAGKGRRFLGSSTGIANALLGGWQLSGIGVARTGLPLNVTLSRSASALPDGINSNQRPDVVLGQPLYPANQGATLWLNPYAFTTPPNGRWGNAGRDTLRAPGIWQADTSLEKRFPVRERFAITLRADLFNVFNRAQLGSPNVKWTNPAQGTTFGAITSAYTTAAIGTGTPRQMQFMLRFSF
ncbi:MAG TPA: TonB-dependent receptor [Bryobacteraceae bacterium]|nr:TonB-dependent receptor [Bryobacteraceae bacterium]